MLSGIGQESRSSRCNLPCPSCRRKASRACSRSSCSRSSCWCCWNMHYSWSSIEGWGVGAEGWVVAILGLRVVDWWWCWRWR